MSLMSRSNFVWCSLSTASRDSFAGGYLYVVSEILYLERKPRKKKIIFYIAYTAQPSKVCYNDATDENSNPRERQCSPHCRKTVRLISPQLVSFLLFRLAPVVVGIKKKRGNSPMYRKSYEKDWQPQSRRLTEKQIAKSENFSGGSSLFS